MYSRSIGKGVVKTPRSDNHYNESYHGSLPTGTVRLTVANGGRESEEESRYGTRLPPGYDGSRFSRRPKESGESRPESEPVMEGKYHNPTVALSGTSQALEDDLEVDRADFAGDPADQPPEIEDAAEGEISEKTDSSFDNLPVEVPTPAGGDSLHSFLQLIKDRVSGEDLLLVVLILFLAVDGEDAELSILLLALLLLVK